MTITQTCPIGNRRNESIKSFLDKEGYVPNKKILKKDIKNRLCYVTKDGEKRKRLHDNLYVDLAYVTRANELGTRISLKAQVLLANLAKMISKNDAGEEFIDHDFLSAITQCRSNKQNRTILGQLADIIDYKYHGCTNFQGKRRVFGYIVKFTADGEKRLQTPELFYNFVPSELVKNSVSKGKKFLEHEGKILTSIYIDNNIDNIKEIDIYVDTSESSFVKKDFVSSSSQIFDQAITATKSKLKDFHPLSEEDAQILNKDSEREFSLNYINQLLLKLDKQKPDNIFKSKKAVLSYMTQSLKYDLRQVAIANNVDFKFKQGLELKQKEEYLVKVEESTDTSKSSQVRRKIAASFDDNTAYEILTSTRYSEYENDSKFQIRLIKPISISDSQRKVLLEQVRAVFGNHIEALEIVEAVDVHVKNVRAAHVVTALHAETIYQTRTPIVDIQTPELDLNTAWGRIRDHLRKYYGEGIDKSWFSRLKPVEDVTAKRIVLKAPTNFFCSYIEQHYLHMMKQFCQHEQYQLNLTV